MKKIYIILALFLLLGNSCVKDLLDKQPLDIISDDLVWNDEILADSYITNIYSNLDYLCMTEGQAPSDRHEMGGGSTTDTWFDINISSELSDEARCTMPWLYTWYRFKPGYDKLGETGGLFEWWGYNPIRKMNVFLEKMETSTLSTDFKKAKIAEVRFLRAMSYFEMAKRYGGVPLITKSQSLDTPLADLYVLRNKEIEIYDFVNSEIDAILPDLPEIAPQTGRPTKYVALAVKSESSLYAASIATWGKVQLNGVVGIPVSEAQRFWQASYDASKQIIGSGKFALYNKYPDNKTLNYRSIFLDENNQEVIFSKEYNGVTAVGHGWDCFQSPFGFNSWGIGNNTAPYMDMVDEYENVDGSPSALNKTKYSSGLWSLDEIYGKKDPRFKASIYTEGTPYKGEILHFYRGLVKPDGTTTQDAIGSTSGQGKSVLWCSTGFGTLKYIDESLNMPGAGESKTDWIIFRYAEILLNFAEAANELGKSGEALVPINQIRERAGILDLTSVDREAIRHERKIELFSENKRYWDLKRWRIATTVLSHSYWGINYYLEPVSGKYKLEFFDADGTNTPRFDEKIYYLPITKGRIANNPSLVENPGY